MTGRALPSPSPWAYFACAVAVATCCCKPAGPKTYLFVPSSMTVPTVLLRQPVTVVSRPAAA